jgi:hypothetical protein
VKNLIVICSVAAWCAGLSTALVGQQAPTDGPRYTTVAGKAQLVRPAEYREWIFLAAGLGMTYQPPAASAPPPQFTNVFVNPSSYRRFLQTGAWPNGTIFVLEVRHSDSEGSINKSGRFQTTVAALEAEVKDSRFADGWAYFDLNNGVATAPPLAGDAVARCVDCHTKNAAVDRTFVQFYPTLLEVARQKRTLKPGF